MSKTKFATAAAIALLAFGIAYAQAPAPATTWDLKALPGYDVMYDFSDTGYGGTGAFEHKLIVDKMDKQTGKFSGTGYYIPYNGYTWTFEGTLVGSNMTFSMLYTGLSAGYWLKHEGTIKSDGNFGGTCANDEQKCTWRTSAQLPPGDCDKDGIAPPQDACCSTPDGAKVNAVGCSMIELCPCVYWKNHGEYVSCIAHAKKEFVAAGILTEEEASAIQRAAAQSDCGKK